MSPSVGGSTIGNNKFLFGEFLATLFHFYSITFSDSTDIILLYLLYTEQCSKILVFLRSLDFVAKFHLKRNNTNRLFTIKNLVVIRFHTVCLLFFQLVFTSKTAPTNTPCTVADEDTNSCKTPISAS